MWVGSAGTAPFGNWFVRQTFEKTEMEWFNWWPFNLLMVLICLNLTVATLRRIPFRAQARGQDMPCVTALRG